MTVLDNRSDAKTQAAYQLDAFLSGEHSGLEEILSDVCCLAEQRSFVQAALRFGEFRLRLEKHLDAEERVLLPMFEDATGDPDDLLPRLHREHGQLRYLMDRLGTSISRWDMTAFCVRLEQITDTLEAHHRDEERALHAAVDLMSPPSFFASKI